MRAILTWHSVDPSGSPISVRPHVFRRQVEWLTSGRVRVVSVEDLLDLNDTTDAVALTFDDAFANFATEAAPLLREHGLPATVFVVSGRVGRDNMWRSWGEAGIPVLPLLGWDDLATLLESGFTLGSHTRTHPRLPTLGSQELLEEVCIAADEMERRLGERPRGFAYPYGAVDARVADVTARCHAWACTTNFRSLGVHESLHRLPRLDAWYFRQPHRLERWGTTGFRARLWCRRQARWAREAVQRVRAASI